MVDNETNSTENPESDATEGKAKAKAKGSARPKKNVEEKLDDMAERFSRTMTDGVKRVEAAFEKGMQNIRNNPDLDEKRTRVKGFFTSSTGGLVLIVVGLVWFFSIVGWLHSPIFPILLIVGGFYLWQKYRND
jgi:hypothetical protein